MDNVICGSNGNHVPDALLLEEITCSLQADKKFILRLVASSIAGLRPAEDRNFDRRSTVDCQPVLRQE